VVPRANPSAGEETSVVFGGQKKPWEHPVRQVFAECADLVDSKCHDYADTDNVFSNFEGAAAITGLSVPQVFHVMIGIKMERLRQIMSGKNMNFESAEDTMMDLTNYAALWIAWEREQPETAKVSLSFEEIGVKATVNDVIARAVMPQPGDYPPYLDRD
jgi:hypothetical protein